MKDPKTPEELNVLPTTPTSEIEVGLNSLKKEIEETLMILRMSDSDMLTQIDKCNSAKKLKALSIKIINRNKEVTNALASHAIKSIDVSIRTLSILGSLVKEHDDKPKEGEPKTSED